METIIAPGDKSVNENKWWFVYNDLTKRVIIDPRQGSGKISSPHTLVVADTKQECINYITSNNLINN
jgi:hypothetical protein